MAPLIPYIVAAFAGGAALALGRSRAQAAPGPATFVAKDPIGYRRLNPSDRVTAEMMLAQDQDLRLPYGAHHSHNEGEFMTAVENPTGRAKIVTLFVPVAVR